MGRPIIDIAKVMITMGMKEVFRHMDQDEYELIVLRKQNEILRGYLHEIMGPIDLDNLKITLVAKLERKGT